MALPKVTIAMRFAGGLESKMDPKAVPLVRLLGLENAVFTRAVSLSKRFGYESLGTAVLGSVTPYTEIPPPPSSGGDMV